MHIFLVLTSLVFLASMSLGLLLILKPGEVIEAQQEFYFKINWHMEPVNMNLELRNTRLMGFMVLAVAAALVAFVFMCKFR